CAQAPSLALARILDAGAHGGGLLAAVLVLERAVIEVGDLDVEIEAIEERAGEAREVAGDALSGAGAGALRGAAVAAGAGVQGGDEGQGGGVGDGGAGAH